MHVVTRNEQKCSWREWALELDLLASIVTLTVSFKSEITYLFTNGEIGFLANWLANAILHGIASPVWGLLIIIPVSFFFTFDSFMWRKLNILQKCHRVLMADFLLLYNLRTQHGRSDSQKFTKRSPSLPSSFHSFHSCCEGKFKKTCWSPYGLKWIQYFLYYDRNTDPDNQFEKFEIIFLL